MPMDAARWELCLVHYLLGAQLVTRQSTLWPREAFPFYVSRHILFILISVQSS